MAKRWFILIGLIIFAVLLLSVDLNKVLSHLLEANLFFVLLAILTVFIVTIVKGIKWKLIINAQNLNFSLIDCIKVFCIGFVLGIITPGRIGDFSRAAYLKKKRQLFFSGHGLSFY
ncbi:MAG: flippase-like domain-containing protein [archaeon]|nr:flippase-like domain-containing protein [archaeon]